MDAAYALLSPSAGAVCNTAGAGATVKLQVSAFWVPSPLLPAPFAPAATVGPASPTRQRRGGLKDERLIVCPREAAGNANVAGCQSEGSFG